MKESHNQGRASQVDPESCIAGRKIGDEALTGAHAGRVLSRENCDSGTPTPCFEAEGHIAADDMMDTGKSPAGPARSQTPISGGTAFHRTRGNSSQQERQRLFDGNREAPQSSVTEGEVADWSEKAKRRASDKYDSGESDDRVVPEQPAKEGEQSYWSLYERVSSGLVRGNREDDDDGSTTDIVRYADDFVMGFEHQHEAERFLSELKTRVEQFGLSLHPEKTRLIEFGRFADRDRRGRGEGGPETFDFLGFTHMCSVRFSTGRFTVLRRSVKQRLRARLSAVKQTLMRMRHRPIKQQGAYLRSVVQGYLNYHAVPGNMPALATFRLQCVRLWLKTLRRRSQRHRMTWDRFARVAEWMIPTPMILHPYPNVRFFAKHPR